MNSEIQLDLVNSLIDRHNTILELLELEEKIENIRIADKKQTKLKSLWAKIPNMTIRILSSILFALASLYILVVVYYSYEASIYRGNINFWGIFWLVFSMAIMSLPSLAWFSESRIAKIIVLFGIIATMFIFVEFIIIGLWNLAIGSVVTYFSYKLWKYKHSDSIKYQEYSKSERAKIKSDYWQEIAKIKNELRQTNIGLPAEYDNPADIRELINIIELHHLHTINSALYKKEISDEMRLNSQLLLENQYEMLNKFNDN
jgi:hypothetical protein